MLTEDDLVEVEGDAAALLRAAKLADDERVDVVALARATMGAPPMLSRTGAESTRIRVYDQWRAVVRAHVPAPRARWLVCHELAEHHYLSRGYRGEDIEARSDALGAALVVPRRLARAAMAHHGHRIARLAATLGVTQALSLLRVGEVDRRPVLLLRRPGVRLARGAAFEWPSEIGRRARSVKLTDEAREGWMAR